MERTAYILMVDSYGGTFSGDDPEAVVTSEEEARRFVARSKRTRRYLEVPMGDTLEDLHNWISEEAVK